MTSKSSPTIPSSYTPVLAGFDLTILLRGIREHHGYTQTSFAKILGYDRSEISRWESGERVPNGEALADYISICELDFAASELLIASWQTARAPKEERQMTHRERMAVLYGGGVE